MCHHIYAHVCAACSMHRMCSVCSVCFSLVLSFSLALSFSLSFSPCFLSRIVGPSIRRLEGEGRGRGEDWREQGCSWIRAREDVLAHCPEERGNREERGRGKKSVARLFSEREREKRARASALWEKYNKRQTQSGSGGK